MVGMEAAYTNEKIESIWSRVSSTPFPDELRSILAGESGAAVTCENATPNTVAGRDDGIQRLRDTVSLEGTLCGKYIKLTRLCKPRRVAELFELANRQYAGLKEIASAYFLLSGEYYFPSPESAETGITDFREGIRSVWLDEVCLAGEYSELAAGSLTGIAGLAAKFEALGAEHEKSMARIMAILADYLK